MTDPFVMMSHLWKGLETGVFTPWSEDQVRGFVNDIHFGTEPMQELSAEDRAVVEKDLVHNLKYYLEQGGDYWGLCQDDVFYFPSKEAVPEEVWSMAIIDEPYFYIPPHTRKNPRFACLNESDAKRHERNLEIFAEKGIQPVSHAEKLRLLQDPLIWDRARCIRTNCCGGLTGYGMRRLSSYGFDDEKFLELATRVRASTDKDELSVLDVGGAIGLALQDVKRLAPDSITHNLTPTIDPVMYPVDHLHVCPAERMPEAFRENMDVVFANMAFCYFVGPSLALENILQSLSVGGEAHLSVHHGKQDFEVVDFVPRLAKQYQRLQQLHDCGVIEMELELDKHYPHPVYGDYKGEKNYPPSFMILRKKKPLDFCLT